MNIKSLNIKYIFYFFLCIIILLGFINLFKKKQLNSYLDYYKNNINVKYNEYYKNYENNSEFIYYNEFIKSRDFINILENRANLQNEDLKNILYKFFLNSYTFYKTLETYNISFYLANGEEILNMEEIGPDPLTIEMVKRVIKNKKDINSFKSVDEKILLMFSKPVFDMSLKLIGIINFEYDFDNLLKKLSQSSDFKYKSFLSNKLSLEEHEVIKLREMQKASLVNHLSKGEDFALLKKEIYNEYPVIFLPIISSEFYENYLYLLAYNTNENNYITKISKYLNIILIVMGFIIALILFLISRLNTLNNEKKIKSKEYENFYSQIDDYVMMVELNLEKKITFSTKSFLKLSGYSKDELIGNSINIIKHPDISEVFFENIWKDLKANKYWKGEVKNLDKFGNSFWLKAIIFPKYDLNDKVIAYSSISVNITDTKQLEKINKLLKEDLSNKLNEIKVKDKTLINSSQVQLMTKILDALSHQWKKPISTISYENQNLIKNLQEDKVNSKKIEEINKKIDLELNSLSSILNEVKYLFTSKEKDKSNLTKIIKETILEIKNELESNNIKIITQIKEDINISIFSNELKNIIINIIKNCQEQKKLNELEEVTISISLIKEKGDLIIKIEDNIKGKYKSIINEVFSSSLDNESKKYTNNFLYLSILLIEKNKGLFWCDNKEYSTEYYIKLDNEDI